MGLFIGKFWLIKSTLLIEESFCLVGERAAQLGSLRLQIWLVFKFLNQGLSPPWTCGLLAVNIHSSPSLHSRRQSEHIMTYHKLFSSCLLQKQLSTAWNIGCEMANVQSAPWKLLEWVLCEQEWLHIEWTSVSPFWTCADDLADNVQGAARLTW